MNGFYIEVREGIGGLESILFTKKLSNLYKNFLTYRNCYYEIIYLKEYYDGYKKILLYVSDINVYYFLNNDSGVHRVQRVPVTDKKGRVHTSTCIVEVFKERIINNININKKDLLITTFKSSGSGGQHVNKTNSAVRIIHIPTGIKVECQKERSQIQNKKIALKILITKLYDKNSIENNFIIKSNRDKNIKKYTIRSTKIRTYNFLRGIIIDHINNKSFSNIDQIFKTKYYKLFM